MRREDSQARWQVRADCLRCADPRLPRGWRDDEGSDEAGARWERWLASNGESEAEGDGDDQSEEGDSVDEGDDGEDGGSGKGSLWRWLTSRDADQAPQV